MIALEEVLRRAPLVGLEILKIHTAHRDQHRCWLAGGLVVHVKPAHGLDHEGLDGDRAIRNEAAAWLVARELGWVDLVPIAVLRTLPNIHAPGDEELCCVQIVVHDVEDDIETAFDDEDVSRAAIFDYLVYQADRKSRNWLLTGKRFFSARRLILIDHGFSFGYRNLPLGSRFFDVRAGRDVSQRHIECVRRLLANLETCKIDEILPDQAIRALQQRAELLLDLRRLPRHEELP